MAERTCTVNDCLRASDVNGAGRGLCPKHYQRWRKHGDVLHERRRSVCSVGDCGLFVVGQGLCSKHYTRQLRHDSLDDPRPWAGVPVGLRGCSACREVKPVADFYLNSYHPTGRMTECALCALARRRLDRVSVFERDEWRCGICATAIDPEVHYPDPQSVSVDHIVPRSRGGSDDQDNLQAAHLICNLRKRARILTVVA